MGSLAAIFNTEDAFSDDNDRSGGQGQHITPRIADESSFNVILANLSSTPYPEQTDQGRRESQQHQLETGMAGTSRDPALVQSQEPMDQDPGVARESQASSGTASKSPPSSSQQNQQQSEAESDSSERGMSSPSRCRRISDSSSRQNLSQSSENVTKISSCLVDQLNLSSNSDVDNSRQTNGSQPQDQERHDGDDLRHACLSRVDSSRHREFQASQQNIERQRQPTPVDPERREGDIESQSQPIVTVFSDANADILHFEPDSSESLEFLSMKAEGKNSWTSFEPTSQHLLNVEKSEAVFS